MTKQEVIQQMRKANKVSHAYFSSNEWMTIQSGKILLEDGVVCSIEEFFLWRQETCWDDGYFLLEENEFDKKVNSVGWL